MQIEVGLLESAQAGDIKAFHRLLSEFQPQLKSYLYRLLADRNEMEDLAHDAFIEAFESVASFKGMSTLKTWVFGIATHLARKRLEKVARWSEDTGLELVRHSRAY